jgi:hypothetical protein
MSIINGKKGTGKKGTDIFSRIAENAIPNQKIRPAKPVNSHSLATMHENK